MLRIFRHYVPKTLVLLGVAEILVLMVSILVGAVLAMDSTGTLSTGLLSLQALVFAGAMLLGMAATGLYQRHLRDAPISTLLRLCLSFVIGFMAMGVIWLVEPTLVIGRQAFALALICSFIGIASCRFIAYQNSDARMTRRVMVLGVGERAGQIDKLRRASDREGISVVGFVDIGTDQVSVAEDKILRVDSSLLDLAERYAVDEIVVALDDRRKGIPIDAILECKMHGLKILEAPEFYERQLGKIRLDSLHPSNVIFADGFSQAVVKTASKRCVDLVASSILLLLSAPLMLVTALAILIESGGPVLYRQERVGLRGKPFMLFKFRSMCTDAERDGVARWASADDDRVTRVGCFIRRTRIDELPQLFNVLRGDMSFVGPRPERPSFVQELGTAIPYYDLRHHVKPGITGWAQVSYPYGASIKDAREKLQYDLYYLKNYSVFLDLTIVVQTIEVILWRRGSR